MAPLQSKEFELILMFVLLVHIGADIAIPMDPGNNHSKPQPKIPKPGTFINCGNNATEAWLRWRPPKLRFGDTALVDFHVIPPEDLREGLLKAWAFLPGETEPMYYSDTRFNCNDIHRFFKWMCPFYKDKPINVKQYKQYIAPSSVIPTGDFMIQLKLFTIAGKELLCLYGHVIMFDD